jgi:hypothetical protein
MSASVAKCSEELPEDDELLDEAELLDELFEDELTTVEDEKLEYVLDDVELEVLGNNFNFIDKINIVITKATSITKNVHQTHNNLADVLAVTTNLFMRNEDILIVTFNL